jgi:hypothetical protein
MQHKTQTAARHPLPVARIDDAVFSFLRPPTDGQPTSPLQPAIEVTESPRNQPPEALDAPQPRVEAFASFYAEISDRVRSDVIGAISMKMTDITCPHCGAGFRRLELWSLLGWKGEYRCPVCDTALEIFDGNKLIDYRLTVQPLRNGR